MDCTFGAKGFHHGTIPRNSAVSPHEMGTPTAVAVDPGVERTEGSPEPSTPVAVDRIAVVTGEDAPVVALVAVDDTVLAQLVHAATTETIADEVTPPLTPGQEWTAVRVAWLRDFHLARRAGLTGPDGEATWAVVLDELVVGSVRLKHTDEQGALETGIWLTRSARGRGLGQAAVAALLDVAATLGATAVRAETTVTNTAALAALHRLGFTLRATHNGQGVQALLLLNPEATGDGSR
jgi:RimJ/RimL family protein N-acetyltransferase